MDVQATVERPYLYILFAPAGHDALLNLTKQKTEEDVEVEDKMRFINGDNPPVNFNCGNQRRRHYSCPGFDGHLSMRQNLNYMAPRK